jgi:trk system potassium uptake protein TrkH
MQPGAVARRLYGRADESDLVTSTTRYTRLIVASYGALTVLGALLLIAIGLDPWTALLHTFASVSTGGFSTSESSLAGIGGTPVYYAVTLICFCSALPLMLYANGVRQGGRHVLGDAQLRWLAASSATFVVVIILLMAGIEGLSWTEAIREGPVLALSAHTTTGFSSLSTAARSDVVKVVVLIAMSIGGCAGSTAGGVKILRLGVLLSLVRFALRRSSMPKHAVLTFGLQGRSLEESEVQKAVVIFLIGGITVGASWLAFLLYGKPPLDSLFEVVSATATVGLSCGLSAPDLPAPLKLVLAADMLLGRVEFIGLLVLFYPRTWIGKRLEVA